MKSCLVFWNKKSHREPSKRFGQEFNKDKKNNNINLSDISNQIYIFIFYGTLCKMRKKVSDFMLGRKLTCYSWEGGRTLQ